MRAGLVSHALKEVLETRRPQAGLVFHNNRGSQYGSGEYRRMLARAGAVRSISARANPYHNAWTESFLEPLKGEMLQGGRFAGEHGARTEIFDFIESYHNPHRTHSSLGYLTPAKFEVDSNTIHLKKPGAGDPLHLKQPCEGSQSRRNVPPCTLHIASPSNHPLRKI